LIPEAVWKKAWKREEGPRETRKLNAGARRYAARKTGSMRNPRVTGSGLIGLGTRAL
jgi:hypothetical protein